jgi:hypothetical protein
MKFPQDIFSKRIPENEIYLIEKIALLGKNIRT